MEIHQPSQSLAVSIVDDSDSFRLATAQLMRSLGYEVATFGSAEDSLKSDRLKDTACLICDVQMPGITGIGLQKYLASQGLQLPIIFVTATPDSDLRARALASGALAFLTKPFDVEKMMACLTQPLL